MPLVTPDGKAGFPETPAQSVGAVTPLAGGASQTFKASTIAKIPEIDFVNQFSENIGKLVQALGLTRRLTLTQGSIVRRYGWDKTKKVDFASGKVGEGELIPLSDAALKELAPIVVDFRKYRKQVTGELIQLVGQDAAINQTDAQLVLQIQRELRVEFFKQLSAGATKKTQSILPSAGSPESAIYQTAFAEVKAQLEVVFENYGGADNVIILVNPMDIAKYVGTASLTTNTAFGLSYLTPFVGVTLLPFNDVPAGHIYATVPQNLILASASVTGAAGSAFGMTSDATGLVGITHKVIPERFVIDTVALTGLQIIAEMPEGVIDMTLGKVPTP